jgi:molybdopterin converting factor small subunit
MRVTVKLFALHRELVGEGEFTAELTDDSTAGHALDWLGGRYPVLRPHLGISAIAINREFSDLSQPLHDGDELAIIPPVSGGAVLPEQEGRVLLTRAPLDPAASQPALLRPRMARSPRSSASFATKRMVARWRRSSTTPTRRWPRSSSGLSAAN